MKGGEEGGECPTPVVGKFISQKSGKPRLESRSLPTKALPYPKVSRHRLGLPAQPDVKHSCVRSSQGHQLHTQAFLLRHGGLWAGGGREKREKRGRDPKMAPRLQSPRHCLRQSPGGVSLSG